MKKQDKEEPVLLEKKPRFKKDLLDALISFAVVIVLSVLILGFVGQKVLVDGHSMNDTLQDGDHLIVDKFTYNFVREPERFEIIVLKLQNRERTFYIKRIIGLPGETIQIIDSVIYINGEPLEGDVYGNADSFSAGIAANPITLGEDEYFVMGDNRKNSKDSRSSEVRTVKRSQLMGRAVFRLWPFSTIGKVK